MVVIFSVMSSQESWTGPLTSIQRAKNCVPGTLSTSPRGRKQLTHEIVIRAVIGDPALAKEVVEDDPRARRGYAFMRARHLEAVGEEEGKRVGVGGGVQQLVDERLALVRR